MPIWRDTSHGVDWELELERDRLLPGRLVSGRVSVTANEDTEYATFPLCEVQPRPGVHLYFGGDPIKSIWLIITSDAALAAVRG